MTYDPCTGPDRPVCRACGHHFDHHRAYAVYCSGGNGQCRCSHYWYSPKKEEA